MIGPIARIIARYAAGALVAKGLLDTSFGAQLAADADVIGIIQTLLGLAIGGATEAFYFFARKLGWAR